MKNIRNIVLTILAVMLFSISSVYSQVSDPEFGPTRIEVKKNGYIVYDQPIKKDKFQYNVDRVDFFEGDQVSIRLYGGSYYFAGPLEWLCAGSEDILSTTYSLDVTLPNDEGIMGHYYYILNQYIPSQIISRSNALKHRDLYCTWHILLRNGHFPYYKISTYPNPASGVLNVDIDKKEGSFTAILCSEATGKMLYNKKLTDNAFSINTQNLLNGRYVLKIYDYNNMQTGSKHIIVRH